MKWFKHDSGAHLDAKLQKVRMKYGLEGYGLYFYCLELIAMNIDERNLTFELEHDSEIIAFNTGMHYERVQEVLAYMANLELFENNNGIITCYKLANRLDQSMTSNPKMRQILAKIKENPDLIKSNHDGIMTESSASHDEVMTKSNENHDAVMTESCKIRLDKNRLDKKETRRKKQNTRFPDDFIVDEKMKAWFEEQDFCFDYKSATEDWEDSMRASGKEYACWKSAWRKAMRLRKKWAEENNNQTASAQSQTASVIKMMPKAGSIR